MPIGELLEAFQALIDAGKIRSAGASNYTNAQLAEALASTGKGQAAYTAFQPHYNLAWRGEYEGECEDMCVKHNLGVITYFSLGAGFLTGKYRSKADFEGKARGGSASHVFQRCELRDARPARRRWPSATMRPWRKSRSPG